MSRGDGAALEFPDEAQYWAMAKSLAASGGLVDEFGFRATRMPLFPNWLAIFVQAPRGVVFAKIAHILIGALCAVLTCGFASALAGRRAGLLAGLLIALDPFLIFFSSLLLTEAVFTTALIALWWTTWPLVSRDAVPPKIRRWLTIAAMATLCVHLRESSLGLIALTLVFTLACRRFDRNAWMGTIIVGGVVVASLVPWAARNKSVTGQWTWLTNRAGISLYDGVGPQATGASNLADLQQMPAVAELDETEWNRYFLDASFRAIRSDPSRILNLAVVKVKRMWNPFPNVDTYQSSGVRFISAAWAFPTFALALAGVFVLRSNDRRQGFRTAVYLLLPALHLTALHSFFVGSVRYRLPAIPMLEILSAIALTTLWQRFSTKGPQRERDRSA